MRTGTETAGERIAGIGLAVLMDILLGGPLTGAAMNPMTVISSPRRVR